MEGELAIHLQGETESMLRARSEVDCAENPALPTFNLLPGGSLTTLRPGGQEAGNVLTQICAVRVSVGVKLCRNCLNIARGTTDPEIDYVTWIKLGNNMAPLTLVANLATRWRHLH